MCPHILSLARTVSQLNPDRAYSSCTLYMTPGRLILYLVHGIRITHAWYTTRDYSILHMHVIARPAQYVPGTCFRLDYELTVLWKRNCWPMTSEFRLQSNITHIFKAMKIMQTGRPYLDIHTKQFIYLVVSEYISSHITFEPIRWFDSIIYRSTKTF